MTASSDKYHILKELAKRNRDNPTLAEKVLWNQLKGKTLGVKFQRQHIIYDFITDFICTEKKLIIEVDGEYHFTEVQARKDSSRSEILSEMGFNILRFTNDEVLYDIEHVIQKIKQTINK